jgi:hypothetical protein
VRIQRRPRRGFTLLIGSILVTLAALSPLVSPSSPAQAAEGDIQLSLDGTLWDSALPRGLFSGIGRVAPGDRVTRTLWVRNATSYAAVLRLSVLRQPVETSALAEATTLVGTSPATPAPGSQAPSSAGCPRVLPDVLLGAGKATTIAVTLEIGDLTAQEGQNQSLAIAMQASLRDPSGPPPADCASGAVNVPGSEQLPTLPFGLTSPFGLAFTGARWAYPALMVAGVLVGVGFFVVALPRRRRRAS